MSIGPPLPWGLHSHGQHKLRQMVLLIYAGPSPAVVYWGEEATIIYNVPCVQLIGDKHPALQGHDPSIEFSEIRPYFDKLLAMQRATGPTKVEYGAFLLLNRHGFFEETYFSWKSVPIIGDEGYVVGSHATVSEVTREIISNRRLSIIRTINKEISGTKCIRDLWDGVIRGLQHVDLDDSEGHSDGDHAHRYVIRFLAIFNFTSSHRGIFPYYFSYVSLARRWGSGSTLCRWITFLGQITANGYVNV
jgi:hypothetical protein